MDSVFSLSPVPDFFEGCKDTFLEERTGLSLSSSEDLDDLLIVPEQFSSKSKDVGFWSLEDLFSADSGSDTATGLSLARTASDASTRLDELSSSAQQLSTSSTADQNFALVPAPSSNPGPVLNLKLDYSSVASAWQHIGGGRPALNISSAELASVAANIPSLQDKAASLCPEAAMQVAGMSSDSSQSPSAVPLSEEDLQARRAALARYKEKKTARSSNPSKKVRYEMRRINAEKRPRIKGRFVKKSELEVYLAQQASVSLDSMVPSY